MLIVVIDYSKHTFFNQINLKLLKIGVLVLRKNKVFVFLAAQKKTKLKTPFVINNTNV